MDGGKGANLRRLSSYGQSASTFPSSLDQSGFGPNIAAATTSRTVSMANIQDLRRYRLACWWCMVQTAIQVVLVAEGALVARFLDNLVR